MKLDGNTYTLSNGRKIDANCGLLSTCRDFLAADGTMVLTEGYDGVALSSDEKLTADERREIAEYMIELWREFGGLT